MMESDSSESDVLRSTKSKRVDLVPKVPPAKSPNPSLGNGGSFAMAVGVSAKSVLPSAGVLSPESNDSAKRRRHSAPSAAMSAKSVGPVGGSLRLRRSPNSHVESQLDVREFLVLVDNHYTSFFVVSLRVCVS